MSEKSMSAVEIAEKRLEKAKLKLLEIKKKDREREFKERTTALVTIGACWAHLLEKDNEKAMRIWNEIFKPAAPRDYFKPGRRTALKNQFGLDCPDLEPKEEPRSE